MARLPELSLQIIEPMKERGRIAIGDIAKLTGANRNTLKKHLAAFTAAIGADALSVSYRIGRYNS